jgi:hypothetical protein
LRSGRAVPMHYLVTRAGYALGLLAAVALIGFTGVLFKLRADASSTTAFTGASSDDVSQVWHARWTGLGKELQGLLKDVGCDANSGTRTFTCYAVFSTDSKHVLRESVVVSPTSYCTGTKRCMVVDNRYFALGKTKETGDHDLLVSLFSGLD